MSGGGGLEKDVFDMMAGSDCICVRLRSERRLDQIRRELSDKEGVI